MMIPVNSKSVTDRGLGGRSMAEVFVERTVGPKGFTARIREVYL